MTQNSTPATPSTKPAQPVDAATQAAAAKALLAELGRKTQQSLKDNPDVLKGVPGGIAGVDKK